MSAQNPAPPVDPDWNPEPLLATVEQAARMLACSPRMIRYFVAHGDLVGRRVGGLLRIPVTSIRAFVKKDHASPSPERKRDTEQK
jgi:excisionase family DNA binding protein